MISIGNCFYVGFLLQKCVVALWRSVGNRLVSASVFRIDYLIGNIGGKFEL